MQLNLAQIKQEVTQLELTLKMAWLQDILAGKLTSDLSVVDDHQVSVQVQRTGLDILLRADLVLRLSTHCSLCMHPFNMEVPADFSITLKPMPQQSVEMPPELELTQEDLEDYHYQGDFIDLDEILREQILLALPMYPRCSQDCKGLCPVCGVDLNLDQCDCERDDLDPRWAALKTLTNKH